MYLSMTYVVNKLFIIGDECSIHFSEFAMHHNESNREVVLTLGHTSVIGRLTNKQKTNKQKSKQTKQTNKNKTKQNKTKKTNKQTNKQKTNISALEREFHKLLLYAHTSA